MAGELGWRADEPSEIGFEQQPNGRAVPIGFEALLSARIPPPQQQQCKEKERKSFELVFSNFYSPPPPSYLSFDDCLKFHGDIPVDLLCELNMKIREVVLKGNDFYSMTAATSSSAAGGGGGDNAAASMLGVMGSEEGDERIAHKIMNDKKALENALPFCDFIF